MSINRKVAVWMATHGVRQCDKRLVYDMRPSMGKQNKTRRVPYMVFFFFSSDPRPHDENSIRHS